MFKLANDNNVILKNMTELNGVAFDNEAETETTIVSFQRSLTQISEGHESLDGSINYGQKAWQFCLAHMCVKDGKVNIISMTFNVVRFP
ncbi:hypothetical protein FQA39_LY11524 [Lamprigera yunnana]|nr:hypothetical protein FQA39_LY11524 [Lamprigera yunnana]